jgi:hypothetical protein
MQLRHVMIKKYFTLLLIFCLFLVIGFEARSQLEVLPNTKWKTLKTNHFEIIFNAEQQEVADLYANKLEKAFIELQKYFRSMPENTIVVINDKTDATNGYATRIPYPHIMVFPVLPGSEEGLAETGDWAFELLTHEFAHILNFEPANGIMEPLRYTFGSIVAPNILLPQWWKEGLSVEIETRIGNHGRLRSAYQDAIIRAMVEDQSFFNFDIAQANESLPSWPEGMRPYLFGSLLWSQIIADHGTQVISELNERHGGRLPFLIAEPARDNIDGTYEQKYKTMQEETAARAQEQLRLLDVLSTTPVVLPSNGFTSVTGPAISMDGRHMALVTEDEANSRAIKIISKENLAQSFMDASVSETATKFNEALIGIAPNDAPPSGSIQRISWYPKSQKIVYDKVDFVNRIERFSDLYSFDLNSKKTEVLTKGLRAREPAVSPNENFIVFVQLEASKTHLALLDIGQSGQKVKKIFSPNLQERISYPIFWDDNTILFSLRKVDGDECLYQIRLDTQTVSLLFPEHKHVRFAKKTSEGLIFNSTLNGVPNLYLADLDLKSSRPITHARTAFFTGDIDPIRKEIFATYMTSRGPRVGTVLQSDWKNIPTTLPKINALFSDRYPPQNTASNLHATSEQTTDNFQIEDYSPKDYLWPQYWIPLISGSSSETGLILQARTSGFDPLKKHSYSIVGSWDTGLNKVSFEGSYLNQTTSLPTGLTLFRRSSYLGTFSNDFTDSGVNLTFLPDVFEYSKNASLQVGFQHIDRNLLGTSLKRSGPFTLFSFSELSQSGMQISPESGKSYYLGASHYIEQSNSSSHTQLLAGGSIFLSKKLPKHHTLLLKSNVFYTPQKISSLLGVSTESLVFVSDNPLPEYILRGYKRGQLFGRNMLAFSTEYRFPLAEVNRGSGTNPIFVKRFSGAFVADSVSTDGAFLNDERAIFETVSTRHFFSSLGTELKLEATLGYIIPIKMIFGYYFAFNAPRGPEGVLGTTFQIPGF